MADLDSAPHADAPPPAAELISEFMARYDTWQKQADDLARGGDQVRAAAGREATDVVARARVEITRTLADARRRLLTVAAEVRAVDNREHTDTQTNTPTAPAQTDHEFRYQFDPERPFSSAQAQPDFAEVAVARVEYPAPPQRRAPTYGERARGRRDRMPVLLVLAACGAIALSFAGWRVARSDRQPAPTAAVERKPQPPASSMEPSAAAAPATTPQPAELGTAPTGVRKTWLWLSVEARRPAWIEVTTDEQTEPRLMLQAGERRRILANQSISIATGDGGAVIFAFNGVPPSPLGRDGQATTRRFTIEDAEKMPPSGGRSGRTGAVPTAGVEDARARPSAVPVTNAELQILTSNGRWLDGYYRDDSNTMAYAAAPDVRIVDARLPKDRMPKGLANVNRSFEKLQFQQRGDQATLVGRMTEQADIRGFPAEAVAIVSQQWRRSGDRWQLTDVRFVSAK
jgi:hypothetical protein